MDSHKDMIVNKFRTPTTKHFFQWGKWLSKGESL